MHRGTRLVRIILAFGPGLALLSTHAFADADCARLAGPFNSAAGSVVLTTTSVEASSTRPWEVPNVEFARSPPARRLTIAAPFCRVSGVIRSARGSNIGFEVWLPPKQRWNGKFLAAGSGGSAGAIQYPALIEPLTRGYAAMSQDNGHTSSSVYDESWAVDSTTHAVKTQQLIDFGYRAQHLATVVGKEITHAYYDQSARHAYFVGCSQGGHHGMMEAQRYPDDYDGIVAGALANDWIMTLTTEAWAASAMMSNHRSGALSRPMLVALNQAVMKACDAADGLVDGQIADPRRCHFDPATLECGRSSTRSAMCLTAPQVAAVRKIYAGLSGSDGKPVALGYNFGSEGGWTPMDSHSEAPPRGSFYDFFRLVVKQDPDWNFLDLDWNSDVNLARERFGQLLDADDPNLSAYREHGGKLIMYHGWADPLIPAAESIRAWSAIRRRMGQSTADEFARLFLVPGMGHCSGGPIGEADWITALEQWVETARPPDGTASTYTIVGSGRIDTQPRSRPYCPYPKVARYRGSGDINHAQSFVCAAP